MQTRITSKDKEVLLNVFNILVIKSLSSAPQINQIKSRQIEIESEIGKKQDQLDVVIQKIFALNYQNSKIKKAENIREKQELLSSISNRINLIQQFSHTTDKKKLRKIRIDYLRTKDPAYKAIISHYISERRDNKLDAEFIRLLSDAKGGMHIDIKGSMSNDAKINRRNYERENKEAHNLFLQELNIQNIPELEKEKARLERELNQAQREKRSLMMEAKRLNLKMSYYQSDIKSLEDEKSDLLQKINENIAPKSEQEDEYKTEKESLVNLLRKFDDSNVELPQFVNQRQLILICKFYPDLLLALSDNVKVMSELRIDSDAWNQLLKEVEDKIDINVVLINIKANELATPFYRDNRRLQESFNQFLSFTNPLKDQSTLSALKNILQNVEQIVFALKSIEVKILEIEDSSSKKDELKIQKDQNEKEVSILLDKSIAALDDLSKSMSQQHSTKKPLFSGELFKKKNPTNKTLKDLKDQMLSLKEQAELRVGLKSEMNRYK